MGRNRGSRTEDTRKGGDIDMLIVQPNIQKQAIHEVAQATGILL
jgi:hypothetical protein